MKGTGLVDSPLRFVPFLRPMVWGGRRLGSVLGKPLPSPGPYGESWDVSDHASHHSVVATGPREGQSLQRLMEQERIALLGPAAKKHTVFPWLVKFLDACDWLSVQVHPDDQAVRELWPGERGKTEAWFILDALPGSRVYAGLLPGMDETRLRAALDAGTMADCLHQFEPQPGDCVFLPAGTVHAVGGGVLMAEVQQTSDATFRLFDWNRRDAQGKARTLHVKDALACIDWSRGPVMPIRIPGFAAGQPVRRRRQPLVNCPYFVLEYWQETGPFSCGGAERMQALLILQGRGRMMTADGAEELTAGQAWLLPASMPKVECGAETPLKMLLCTLP